MKHFKYLPLLIISFFSQAYESNTLMNLSDLRWENRLIIINEPVNSNTTLTLMKNHITEINERDIVWFIINQNEALTNYSGTLSTSFISKAQQKYRLKEGTVTLIGKDGGIKSQQNRIDVQTLFSTIDAMPMRRHEIRKTK